MTTTSIFRDAANEKQYLEKGFFIADVLDEAGLEAARGIFARHHPEDLLQYTNPHYAPKLFTTTFKPDQGYREAVDAELRALFQPALETLFQHFKVFMCGFLVKLPGEDSELRMHQDFSLFDETKYTPVTIWCPLQDLVPGNGALTLLPGTNQLPNPYRGTSIPQPYNDYVERIREKAQPQYLKAGQAVAFTQATFHGSEPNTSDQPRVIASALVAQEDAHIELAFQNPETPSVVELHRQTDDYLVRNPTFSYDFKTGMPKPSAIRTAPIPETETSIVQLETLLTHS